MLNRLQISCLLYCLILMTAAPLAVYASDGQIKLAQTVDTSFPIIINQPGSYILTSNLTVNTPDANAININTNNVSIDLNGHSIDGPSSSTGYGVYASERNNISIRNGVIKEFNYGIYLYNSSSTRGGGHLIADIRTQRNVTCGIYACYSVITRCTANNNGRGIEAYHSTIRDCSVNYNTAGIGAIYAINGIVTGCTANYNTSDGIYTYQSDVNDSIANFNSGNGIAGDGTVTNCNASSNHGTGITCSGTVIGCSASSNEGDGISSNGGEIIHCVARLNHKNGIIAHESLIKGCNVRDNDLYGIENSPDFNHPRNYIFGNVVNNNGTGQINCTENLCTDNYLP